MLDVAINAAPLAPPRTGIGRYIAGLLEGLVRLTPAEVRVHPLFVPGPTRSLRPLVKQVPFAYRLNQLARAALLERERRRGVTVYHETNHAAPAFRGPVVITVHDLSTVLYPGTQEAGRSRHFARALRGKARTAARVIVPTDAIGREVSQHLGVDPARVRTIHHGIDERFTPGGGPRKGYVLYAGALDPRKGLGTLLDALPEGVQLVLAGPKERATDQVKKSLGGRISATGFVSEDELLRLYREAALLVLPSIYEGFGFPLAEAMACGTPCIVSDDPALVEVAGGAALHFPRRDAASLRAQLERVLGDAALREELAQKGIARAGAFRWDACARAHARVYLEAAGEAAPA